MTRKPFIISGTTLWATDGQYLKYDREIGIMLVEGSVNDTEMRLCYDVDNASKSTLMDVDKVIDLKKFRPFWLQLNDPFQVRGVVYRVARIYCKMLTWMVKAQREQGIDRNKPLTPPEYMEWPVEDLAKIALTYTYDS